MKTKAQLHWDYFLLLERDLVAIADTVELSEKNCSTFGPRILQLILNAGSELDTALKSLDGAVNEENVNVDKLSMREYKDFIARYMLEEFTTAEVKFLHSEVVLAPWSSLANDGETPTWWKTYNNVKHHRDKYYEFATLRVALEVTAALFVVDVHLKEADYAASEQPRAYGSTRIIEWEHHKLLPQLEKLYAKRELSEGKQSDSSIRKA